MQYIIVVTAIVMMGLGFRVIAIVMMGIVIVALGFHRSRIWV